MVFIPISCFFSCPDIPLVGPRPPPHSRGFLCFLDHTQRHATVGRTPLDEWSARRRDLYLTTHNTHNRQISMPPVGFESTISTGERPYTYTLDRTATGTGSYQYLHFLFWGSLWILVCIPFTNRSLCIDMSRETAAYKHTHTHTQTQQNLSHSRLNAEWRTKK